MNSCGLRTMRLYTLIKSFPSLDKPPSLTGNCFPETGDCPARTRVSNLGRSISTGQASLHAPHKEEACASGTKSEPKNPAEMTDPMGPGYTLLYPCPPISRNTGQAFKHAPQRIQYRDSF